jgi:hypothetical protein
MYALTIAPVDATRAPHSESTAEAMDDLVLEAWEHISTLRPGTVLTLDEPGHWTITHTDGDQDTLTITEQPATTVAGALAAIRAAYPTAATFKVSSSDQGSYGYFLENVTLADGTVLSTEEQAVASRLMPALDVLIDLDWGSFGDRNEDSLFEVSMTTGRMPHLRA